MFTINKHGNRVARLLHALSSRIVLRTLEVTAMDLAVGQPGAPRDCPVALAAKRMFPKASGVSVYGKVIDVFYEKKDGWVTEGWVGGQELRAFVAEIDNTAVPQDVETTIATGHWSQVNPDIQPQAFTIRLVHRVSKPYASTYALDGNI